MSGWGAWQERPSAAPGVSPIPPPSSQWGPAPGQPAPDQPAPGQRGPGQPGPARPASREWSPWGPPAAAPVTEPLTRQLPLAREPEASRWVPRWIWPAVAVLALLVGMIGGALGAALVQESDPTAAERVEDSEGLETVGTASSAPLPRDNGSVQAVAQALLPSTLQIIASYEGDDAGATGSGFVLDRQGHVVTNNHVVASAAEDQGPIVVVDHEGERHDATVVGRSPVYDLAILELEGAEGLVPAALGESESLQVGDPVVAFGSPLGLSQTVTAGIVSALDRPVTTGDEDNQASYINAVQTDAAINPGNSGGPLVNLAGEVVGVNSAIATTGGGFGGEGAGNIGVGFAIPIEQVRTTADQILSTGEARYPVIGAQVRVGGDPAEAGAEITEVMPDTPAEEAGLKKDDVVTKVDGEHVADGIALIVAIRTHQPGDTIELTVLRGDEEWTVEVTLDGEVG
ncbi:hypothetical protein DDE18_16355 [Nocardioides gansuensis]|uniref:PDZ domain-containing protein n=1 Tax=Nocardioides gansuensis TaxID=2138300 RepID=A0A2T8F7W3_9ACTN|nr:hypothetical protein DDE18_16355 [Nocardioides gansuensis]